MSAFNNDNNNNKPNIKIDNKTLTFSCGKCIYMNNNMSNYIIVNSSDNTVYKIITYQKYGSKMNSTILKNDDNHPAFIEMVISDVLNLFLKDTPHITNVSNIMRCNGKKLLIVNGKTQELNNDEFYDGISFIKCELAEMDLDRYLITRQNTIEDDEFIDIMFQIFYTLHIINKYLPNFVHGDLMLSNILMCKNPNYIKDQIITYEIDNKVYGVKSREYIPKLWDFEFSSYSKLPNSLFNDVTEEIKTSSKMDVYRLMYSIYKTIEATQVAATEVMEVGINTTYNAYSSYPTTKFINSNNSTNLTNSTNLSYNDYPVTPIPEFVSVNKIVPRVNLTKYQQILNDHNIINSSIINTKMMQPTINQDEVKTVEQVLKSSLFDSLILNTSTNINYKYTNIISQHENNIYDLLDKRNRIDLYNVLNIPKVIIFDFDSTLVNRHTFGQERALLNSSDLFNNYDNLHKLLLILKNKGVKFAIATFAKSEYIKPYVDRYLPNIFDIVVASEGREVSDDKCITTNKNEQLLKIYNSLAVIGDEQSKNNVLYFDDDTKNINCVYTPLNYDDNTKKIFAERIETFNNLTTGVTPGLIWSELIKSVYLNQNVLQSAGNKSNYKKKYMKYKTKYMNLIYS
jgi:hypothetical protein